MMVFFRTRLRKILIWQNFLKREGPALMYNAVQGWIDWFKRYRIHKPVQAKASCDEKKRRLLYIFPRWIRTLAERRSTSSSRNFLRHSSEFSLLTSFLMYHDLKVLLPAQGGRGAFSVTLVATKLENSTNILDGLRR